MATVAPSVAGASKKDALSCSIRWEVDKDTISYEKSYSPTAVEVGGMPWRISVNKSFNEREAPVLEFCLECGDCELERVYVKAEVMFINHCNKAKKVICKIRHTIRYDDRIFGYATYGDMARFAKEGFIKDNKIILQIDFSLSNIARFGEVRRIDFCDPSEPSHDVTLVIGGEKIYVNKQQLSIYYPVFLEMFNGDFIEKNQKEIELKEIDYKEFVELLKVIYPPCKKITDKNFKCLLNLCDRFEINMVTNQIEQFLINSPTFSIAAKFLLAEKYRLSVLQNHCLDQLKTTKDVRNMENSDEAKNE